ncbi:hypothetical protein MNB_SM-3-288 [hydrothermal vent metagenome]|uniref:Uncharacterized protein n=1 Tax=hydrothermal vent metagenome TaxID=652676 RepID=A0A1W1D5C3_9ZZZZ
MKKILYITIGTLLLGVVLYAKKVPDYDEKWHSHRPLLQARERNEEKAESKKNALEILDKLLSPFEDIIEYALNKNLSKMQMGYKNIKALTKSKLFKQSISDSANEQILQDIDSIGSYIRKENYAKVALLSTKVFKNIINNYEYSEYILNQIYIENLDGMGFEILSLIEAGDIDFTQIQSIINETKKDWMFLRDDIDDENKIDAFDLLFEGLLHATLQHDDKMLKILASMDLALVDIIEKQFE